VVAGHALGTHGAELLAEPGPELLQAHDADASAPAADRLRRTGSYAGGVIGTGSDTLDLVLEIGIALALLASLVLLWRNYRGR
jgi:hypothetical protein